MRCEPDKDLHRKVVDAMTTNETSFFRDIHPFEALRKVILPEIIARRAKERQLRFWCGAASTGQEPYSVMMLIAQHFPELLNWDLIVNLLPRTFAVKSSPGLEPGGTTNLKSTAAFQRHFW